MEHGIEKKSPYEKVAGKCKRAANSVDGNRGFKKPATQGKKSVDISSPGIRRFLREVTEEDRNKVHNTPAITVDFPKLRHKRKYVYDENSVLEKENRVKAKFEQNRINKTETKKRKDQKKILLLKEEEYIDRLVQSFVKPKKGVSEFKTERNEDSSITNNYGIVTNKEMESPVKKLITFSTKQSKDKSPEVAMNKKISSDLNAPTNSSKAKQTTLQFKKTRLRRSSTPVLPAKMSDSKENTDKPNKSRDSKKEKVGNFTVGRKKSPGQKLRDLATTVATSDTRTSGVCQKTYSNSSHLKYHTNTTHNLKSPLTCVHCDKSFSTNQSLTTHINMVHLGLKPHTCSHCSKSFGTKGSLRDHVTEVHLKLKPFSCQHCSASFSSKRSLRRHSKTLHR